MQTVTQGYQELTKKLEKSDIHMENGSLFPVSFSPYTISKERYNQLGQHCEIFLDILEIFVKEYIDNKEIRELFPENLRLQGLECISPRYRNMLNYARFDFIEDKLGNFKLLETNCACPGGVLLTPVIGNILATVPYHMSKTSGFSTVDQKINCLSFFFKFLISLYREAGGKEENPVIAYVNSNFDTVTSDLKQFLSVGKDLGFNVVNAHIQNIEYKDGTAYYEGQVIDIAHGKYIQRLDKDFMIKTEIYRKNIEEIDNYIKAVENGKLIHINSFPSFWIAENKKLLSLVQGEGFRSKLNNTQLDTLKAICIDTFLTDQKDKKFVGKVKENKNNYIVKSSIGTRSQGICIGKEMEQNDWSNFIDQILDKPYVIQEYVESRQDQISIPNSAETTMMNSTVSVYIVGRKFSGLLCRSSSTLKTNFYASGVFRPAYVIN